MTNKDTLKKILNSLKPVSEQRLESFDKLDKGVFDLTSKVKDEVKAQSLDSVNSEINKFRKSLDYTPIVNSINDLKGETGRIASELSAKLEDRNQNLSKEMQSRMDLGINDALSKLENLNKDIESLTKDVTEVKSKSGDHAKYIAGVYKKAKDFDTQFSDLNNNFGNSLKELKGNYAKLSNSDQEKLTKYSALEKDFKEFRTSFNQKISKVGGGAPNQQVNVNSSVMSLKYADINFKAGNNMTISKSDDNVNKRVNITFTSSGGGGGSPGGNDTEIQFNDNGSFGGNAALTFDKSSLDLNYDGGTTGNLVFQTDSGNTGININTAGYVVLGARNNVELDIANGSFIIADPTLATASNGYVWTLANQTTGSGQWASVVATGGTGISRISSVITASQTAGSTANKDYVYFCAAGIQVTLPTAVGNSNLYTIKSKTSSSVLLVTTGGQTIDGSATALMPVQNQSLDLISDNTNWNVV